MATALQLLLKAVTAMYANDPTAPGVVLAQLPEGDIYASIVRYHGACGTGKEVVAHVRGPGVIRQVRALARKWRKGESDLRALDIYLEMRDGE